MATYQEHVDEDVVGVEVGEEDEVAHLHAEKVVDVGEARVAGEGLEKDGMVGIGYGRSAKLSYGASHRFLWLGVSMRRVPNRPHSFARPNPRPHANPRTEQANSTMGKVQRRMRMRLKRKEFMYVPLICWRGGGGVHGVCRPAC